MSFGDIVGISLCVGLLVAWCLMWGSITDSVISSKGYTENWFWRGFLFGVAAYRAALRKPEADDVDIPYDENATSILLKEESTYEKMTPDSWQCRKCCKWNLRHVAVCGCGNSKDKNVRMMREEAERLQQFKRKEANDGKSE